MFSFPSHSGVGQWDAESDLSFGKRVSYRSDTVEVKTFKGVLFVVNISNLTCTTARTISCGSRLAHLSKRLSAGLP
ncbi:hypothetical protein M758_1G276500 [Ceratodon purpureus]|nr:hypothetical protein M758_1G276500 [Ceratodon purpureus]